MRRFELVIAFAAVVAVLWPVVFGVRPRRGIVAAILIAAFIAHLQVEGFRWQMIPLYGVTLGLAVGDVLFIDRGLKWSNRVSRGLFGTSGLVLALALPFLLPVPALPRPSGGLAVGTLSLEIVDREREMAYGADPEEARRFMVQVWYPALPTTGVENAPWSLDWDVVAPAMSRRLGFPSWFLSHTKYTTSHSAESAPVAPGTYPVVIYSHGWTGFRSIAVNQMETLASNGYVVIAPDHTYGAVVTRFPDGELIRYSPDALPPAEAVGGDAHLRAGEQLIAVFAADLVSVLDELEAGVDGRFANFASSLDLSRIGLFGHSAGGGAAVQVCLFDERCAAVLGFDPWVEPFPARVLRERATRPALFMRSDGWRGTQNDALLRGMAGRGDSVTYWLGVEGAGHNDFVVTPFLSPIAGQLGLKGPIGAGRIVSIIDNYLVGFFDVFLLETGAAALDTVTFPAVTLETIRR